MARNIPPSQHGDPLRRRKLLEDSADVLRAHLIFRQKKHPHAVFSRPAQLDSFLQGPSGKKAVGQFCQNSDPVAGRSECVAPGPVGQALHNGKRLVHGPVGGAAVQVRHRSDAAAFMFKFFMIKGILSLPHVPSPL